MRRARAIASSPSSNASRGSSAHVGPGHVQESPCDDRVEPLGLGQGATGLHRPEPLVRPAVDADERALRDQDVGHVGEVVEALRASKGAVRQRRCPIPVFLEPICARQLVLDLDDTGVVTEVLECGERRFEQDDRVGSPPSIDHGSTAEAHRSRLPLALAQVVPDRRCIRQTRLGSTS